MAMKNLIEARHRYQRLLDALGYSSRVDRELRAELIEAIDNMDEKIGQMSEAANAAMPGSNAAARIRSAAG